MFGKNVPHANYFANLSGLRAVVTGASSGIGRAIALEIARAGANVMVHFSRSNAAAELVAQEIRQLGRQARRAPGAANGKPGHSGRSQVADHRPRREGPGMTADDFDQIFPRGATNDAFAQYFTGQSYQAPLVDGRVPVSNITFEPGCRNNWHIHHGEDGGGDQVLLCTAGSGWYQADGEEPISMVPGTAVRVPAGTKHWHGAKADSWFSHLAFITPGENVSNEWLEPVTDEVYGALPKNGDAA